MAARLAHAVRGANGDARQIENGQLSRANIRGLPRDSGSAGFKSNGYP